MYLSCLFLEKILGHGGRGDTLTRPHLALDLHGTRLLKTSFQVLGKKMKAITLSKKKVDQKLDYRKGWSSIRKETSDIV